MRKRERRTLMKLNEVHKDNRQFKKEIKKEEKGIWIIFKMERKKKKERLR